MTVILINPFEVPEEIADETFLGGWNVAADYMRAQPGFVSSQLHRALSPNARFRFINVAEWATPQDFQAAMNTPQFRELARESPTSFPALYEVVRSIGAGATGAAGAG